MRKEFVGNAPETELTAPLAAATLTTFTVLNGSLYPEGTTAPFVVTLSRGNAEEEKILCTSRTGNVFTIQQRGYDGTLAQLHVSGATVQHTLDADTIQEANIAVQSGNVAHFGYSDLLEVAEIPGRLYALADMRVEQIHASVDVAPTGSGVFITATYYTAGGAVDDDDTVTIADGTNVSSISPAKTLLEGQYIKLNIDSVGSSTEGKDLVVGLRFKWL